jgi:hypothetical protein
MRHRLLLLFALSYASAVHIIHHHIAKTGGASLIKALKDSYGISESNVWRGYHEYRSMRDANTITQRYSLLTGHYNINFWLKLNVTSYPADIVITEVREPFNRMISDYLFRGDIEHSQQDLLQRLCGRVHDYKFPPRCYSDYHILALSRQFSPVLEKTDRYYTANMTTQVHLDDAIAMLQTIDFVLMIDFLQTSLSRFEQRYGKALPYEHAHNAADSGLGGLKQRMHSSEQLFAAFYEYNRHDYQLYLLAVQQLTGRSVQLRQPTMSRAEACGFGTS